VVHGDDMVPVRSYTRVGGVPVEKYINRRTPRGNREAHPQRCAEIVNLMKTSSYYAAGTAVYQMVEAFILDRKQVLPCAVVPGGRVRGEGLFAGVQWWIGAGGVERVIEIALTDAEKKPSTARSPRARAGRGDGQSSRGLRFRDRRHHG